MKNIKITHLLFVLLAAIQWIIPGRMIYQNEDVLKHGVEYKFKTAPIDPTDAMRGKYVALSFDLDRYETSLTEEYKNKSYAYIVLKNDSAGYAAIDRIEKTTPPAGDYIKVEIFQAYERDNMQVVHLNLPFDRYYMEESKAEEAEKIYRESNNRDNESEAFAVVRVKDGKAVLADLYVDAKPISSYFEGSNP